MRTWAFQLTGQWWCNDQSKVLCFRNRWYGHIVNGPMYSWIALNAVTIEAGSEVMIIMSYNVDAGRAATSHLQTFKFCSYSLNAARYKS